MIKDIRPRKIEEIEKKEGLDSAQFDLIWTKLLVMISNKIGSLGCCEARFLTKDARKNKVYFVYVVFERLLAPYRPPIVEA